MKRVKMFSIEGDLIVCNNIVFCNRTWKNDKAIVGKLVIPDDNKDNVLFSIDLANGITTNDTNGAIHYSLSAGFIMENNTRIIKIAQKQYGNAIRMLKNMNRSKYDNVIITDGKEEYKFNDLSCVQAVLEAKRLMPNSELSYYCEYDDVSGDCTFIIANKKYKHEC